MKAALLAIAALLFSTAAVTSDALPWNEGLDETRAQGWTVVRMKDDWKRILPDVAP
jgi:hypothetical protein